MSSAVFLLMLLLSASVAAVAVMRSLRLPSILAYLAIGMVLGPHGAGALVASTAVDDVAEFGVVFLMFSIGLEFSLTRLMAMRRLVFGLGAVQLTVTAAAATAVAVLAYGQDWRAGLAVGLAVAMSSTAIVAKLLSERFELHSRSGRQTMGVLLFQDLAVVPCLILLPALARPRDDLVESLALAAVGAAAVLVLLVFVGQRVMRRLFDVIARVRSDELFVLATLWLVVSLAYVTGRVGLSMALGAFIGGMLCSETIYRHQVEADIRPFRDMLLGLFFVTVGMLLDVGFVAGNVDRLLVAVALLIGGKGLVVLAATLAARNSLDVALRTSAQLAQAGEFGLVLIGVGHELKLIGDDVFQLTLSAMLTSMFLAPLLIRQATRLSGEMVRGDWAHKAKAIHDIAAASFGLADHVIICGYGRTGRLLAGFLAEEQIPFLALDLDPQQLNRPGEPGRVLFGSADRIEVLQAAGLARARAIVITYPDVHSALRVLHVVRQRHPDLPVVVRAADDSAVEQLKRAGASEVVPEVLEGGLALAIETLTRLDVPVDRTVTRVRARRAERYATLRGYYRAGEGKKRN